MKVSDEDLITVTTALLPYATRSGMHNLADAVVGELKSLRKVADAASVLQCGCPGPGCVALRKALRAVGRWPE